MGKLTKLNFAKEAEQVIESLKVADRRGNVKLNLTTSKIRNLLSMSNALYNQALKLREDALNEQILHDIQYLKMRFAYEVGRDEKTVGEFVKKAHIMEHIDEIKNSRENLIIFCNYMESLVAYHKYHGGRDR